jgi:hypothetical protein
VPPAELRIRGPDVNYAGGLFVPNDFCGEMEGSFRDTSMQLRLTQRTSDVRPPDWEGRFSAVPGMALHETLVQVYDGADWVGDLDVLSALQSELLSRAVCKRAATCPTSKPRSRMFAVADRERLLEPPSDPAVSVVQMSGSWLERLAAVGVASG